MLSQTTLKQVWAPRCTGPWARVDLYGAGAVTVRPIIVQAVKALDQCLRLTSYETRQNDTGAYVCRMTASGTWSLHAYATAMDINWQSNPYGRTLVTDMPRVLPQRIVAIRTNNGKQVWNWGGYWSGNKDAMHYEIVCSPADLRTGINWSTVYGGGSDPTPIPPQEDDFDMTHDEIRLLLAEAANKQNEWTRSEIDKAVAEIKTNNATLRDGLAKLIRAFAAKLNITGI